jgi:hypothetical protein
VGQTGDAIAALWTAALKGRQQLADFLDCLENQVHRPHRSDDDA